MVTAQRPAQLCPLNGGLEQGLWRCLFIRATTAFWRSTKHLQLFISGAREPLLAQ